MKKIISLFVIFIVGFACSKNEDSTATPSNNYDRTALLTNWANNIIIPSYVNYQSKLQILTTNVASFNTAPSVSNLQLVRTSWLEAYKAYQYVSMYNFGKAEELYIKETSNTYPTNITGINNNITTGTYNLSLISQFDKQGFPAIDYLLHGLANTDTQILEFYTSNALASNYKDYLQVNANKLKAIADLIVTDWNSSFKASYIANNGTSVTSSVNKTTNNFVKNLEKDIRTGKLGIPAGVFSSGVKFSEKVEGFYKNDISKILLNEAVKASQDFFNGKHFESATTGEGLKSYLDFLNAVRNNQKLSDIINNQFTPIYAANNALNNSFSTQVNSDNAKMLAAYDALQQNVIYTKLDMMQALNISIDYVDGDGD
jgi:Imelysin